MSVFTGDSRYGEMIENFEGKEEITMCDVLDYREKVGERRGEQRGIAMGVLQGEARMSELVSCLLADGRLEDLKRSTGDVSFREQLLKEYCLA